MVDEKVKKASKVKKTTKSPAKADKGRVLGKPIQAIIAFITILAGAILLLVYPFTIGTTDAIGVLFFIFGLMFLPLVYYVFKVEYWSWSSVVIVLILVLLLAIPSISFVIIGYAIILIIVLFFIRRTYGVGLWKIQQEKEERERKVREAIRTANKEGYHCPRCGSTDLYVCEDGSTYCRNCKVGFVDIRNLGLLPKSSIKSYPGSSVSLLGDDPRDHELV
ncbi:MAG: hypothetical protein ACFFDT_23040, partial [Candidatus Hodarchaeota archaeon]